MVRSVKSRGGYEYTRAYSDLLGVELGGTGSKVSTRRLAYAENMYRDYEGDSGGLIESIPGYRRVADLGEGITALYPMKGLSKDYLIARAGKRLYRISTEEIDSVTALTPLIELKGDKSAVFPYGSSLYLTDVDRLIRVGEEGEAEVVSNELPYAPTVRLNGEIFEQKNLLTDRAHEEYVIADASEYSYGHPALRYKILDNDERICAVSGVSYYPGGVVQVPSTTLIGGKRFRVKEILTKAFAFCTRITDIYIAEGVERIGTQAFHYDKALETVCMPSTLTEVGSAIFGECDALTDVYFGSGIMTIGSYPFGGCSQEINIHYAGNSENFQDINGKDNLGDRDIIYDSEKKTALIEMPLTEECIEVTGARLGEEEVEFTPVRDGERVRSVIITSDKFYDDECDIVIDITLAPHSFSFGVDEKTHDDISAIIGGMTVAEVFDGRVFLAGSPTLPNTIIFSARTRTGKETPLYFGSESYMNDGVGGYPVVAMLAVRDSLAVFKAGDDGTGSIFYHTPTATNDPYMPKIYPVEYVHSGIGTVGGAISFLDDPVFLTSGGLMALTQKAINYERSVATRSHNVNFDLLRHDLAGASLTEWQGYLVIGTGDVAYLADSRALFSHASGSTEYEWFVLSGLGEYKNSTRVYRYDSYSVGNYLASDKQGEIAEGVVYSVELDGEMIRYVTEDEKNYTVYPTREYRGGDFYPATAYLGIGRHLFFGTEGGALYVFNNDMRGVAPDFLARKPDFDPEDYAKHMGRSIHPSFYSFDGHAPRYAIRTAFDGCDIPHLTKSTIKHSLVVKYRTFSSSEIVAEVLTDKGKYSELCRIPCLDLCFDEINFETMTLSALDYNTVPIAEKEKNWIEKQITIYSDKFESPIGIYSIIYRYMVKGRIKKD